MFFKDWIKIEEEQKKDGCKVFRYCEIPDSREKIYGQLIETLISHYAHPKRINKFLKNEKFSKLETYINKRMPTKENYKKGDFGEFFGTEHLKQFYNYTFPILKLNYKPTVDESLKGEDIIGFFIENNEITRICIGESKVRKNSDSSTITEAINQLEKSYTISPKLLSFISDRAYDSCDEELAEKIEDLLSPTFFSKIKKDNWIFLITGNKPKMYKIKSNKLNNLILINMYFEDLNEFITTLYEDCRRYYEK